MSGAEDGKIVHFQKPHLGTERVLTVGRREGCDIHIAYDSQVSRVHAYIGCAVTSAEVDGLSTIGFWLEDQGSRNGTYLHNSNTALTERIVLIPGILFRVGRTWLQLDIPIQF